jgi:transcriptional regulator with XRE-family HTH domain
MDSTGKRIKHCREKAGYTQDEMAALMGKSSKQTISSWENDKNEPTLTDFKKLASLLSTTVAFLIGESENISLSMEPSSDYITITKDELIALQRAALDKKDVALKEKEQQLSRLKNDR